MDAAINLKAVLEKHSAWWFDPGWRGKRADLSGADLRCADLRCADLRCADLRCADLRCADLMDANLMDADLSGADLRCADLRDANLRCANLRYADLRCADLSGANLRCANLRYADLRDADLRDANLRDTDLRNTDLRSANLMDANLRYADLRDADLAAPRIEHVDAAILAAIRRDGCALYMGNWHTCETTHCRAGWAIHLAGEAGYELERCASPSAAGALIYAASRPGRRVPDFYATTDEALADLEACAKEDPL